MAEINKQFQSKNSLDRHDFYPGRNRQRCTLRHVIYTVQYTRTFYHLYYKSHPSNTLSDPQNKPESSRPLVTISTTRPLKQTDNMKKRN
ncbi:hypothetical protein SFRURICE_006168 [Spodoptera frugiperda]|nr:hypothetical protein SFRURICE_006168 [Spodoptera frugiperda]